MTLGEKIKSLRKGLGMSQEKLAELMGISRQAVAKWENGQSAPSTANLFKLAEILNTTTAFLLADDDAKDTGTEEKSEENTDETKTALSQAEEFYRVFKAEEERKNKEKKQRIRKNIIWDLVVILAYLALYIIGRLIWCRTDSSLTGLLWASTPEGENSYLYGWLLSSGLFWVSLAISALPALLGKKYFSAITFGGFILGLILGIIFGPNPEGVPYGHGHYGWAIWGGIFILSVILGIIFEVLKKRSPKDI